MNASRPNRFKFVLIAMFVYILAQLGWWAYLIAHLTEQVYEDDVRLSHRVMMVWGEGFVFAIILLIGFVFTYKSYLRELLRARQQRNFLMSVTHEFKTPIASLSLYLQTLQNRELSPEKRQELIQRALRDTERLNSLAENILLTARIEHQAFPLHKNTTDLSVFVEQLMQVLIQTHGKRYHIKLNIEAGILFHFDEMAMHSILTNLFVNAVKYTPEDSLIEISLHRDKNKIELSISDQGPGIPEKERRRVFDKFVRLGDENRRSAKGTGLGLYITRYFITQHGGEISIDENYRSGTKFIVNFPVH